MLGRSWANSGVPSLLAPCCTHWAQASSWLETRELLNGGDVNVSKIDSEGKVSPLATKQVLKHCDSSTGLYAHRGSYQKLLQEPQT